MTLIVSALVFAASLVLLKMQWYESAYSAVAVGAVFYLLAGGDYSKMLRATVVCVTAITFVYLIQLAFVLFLCSPWGVCW